MASTARDYRGIRGSAALGTAPLAAVPEVARAEGLEPGEMRRVAFEGELLGAARVRSRFAPLPFEAFDRAGEVLAADEQGAYFQLLRLAYGEGRNFCRAGKKDLAVRLRLSERRLHRVLDALVAKGFVRPLHRDNRGTLWRVYLPAEAFGEPVGDDVLLGRAGPANAPAGNTAPRAVGQASAASALPGAAGAADAADAALAPAVEPAAAVTPAARAPTTVSAPATATPLRRATPRAALAAALAEARGQQDPAAAAEELAALAADGATPRQIEACVAAAVRRAAGEMSRSVAAHSEAAFERGALP